VPRKIKMGVGKTRCGGRTGATESRADLVIAEKVGPGPTTQTTPGIDKRRGKREVKNKTKTDRLMVGKTNGSFSKIFLKKTFFTSKIQSR
jgi:hypothetical protein